MNKNIRTQTMFSRRGEPARGAALPLHVAIIPDGNGRWAAARGLPRSAGHEAGVEAVRRVVAAAPDFGISLLTFYTFSADNWERPVGEVRALLDVLGRFLREEPERYAQEGIRLSVIGRRDRLSPELRAAMAAAERATAEGRRLHVRLAVDYSAQESILRAACRLISSREISAREFARLLGLVGYGDGPSPEVDLLIRSGGEQRLSDFLLWESVYAELVFTPRLWPDFSPKDLEEAVAEFHGRERRFGRVPEAVAG
jgi:undecaprenyl diphosphate synthase